MSRIDFPKPKSDKNLNLGYKVFMLDDEYAAATIKIDIKEMGCEVDHAPNLASAVDYLIIKNSVAHYDIFLFDLYMEGEEFDYGDGNGVRTHKDPEGINGLNFIEQNYHLFRNYLKRIAFITAFPKALQRVKFNENPGISKIPCFFKTNENYVRDVINFIMKKRFRG